MAVLKTHSLKYSLLSKYYVVGSILDVGERVLYPNDKIPTLIKLTSNWRKLNGRMNK